MKESMIKGIGNDLIEIDRIQRAIKRQRFLDKAFTQEEILLSQKSPRFLAGNFAVKEAVSKALGTGFRQVSLLDLEVLRDDLGKPYVRFFGPAKDALRRLGGKRVFVSISNTRQFAAAIAVIE